MAVRRLSRDAWAERAWQAGATYFHTPQWYALWARWQGWTVFALDFGREGWMPVAVKGAQAVSSPPGTYGGPVCSPAGNPRRLWDAVRTWARQEGVTLQMLTMGRPPWPARAWETCVAVLPPVPDRIPHGWRATHRNYWRRTYRNGVDVRPLTPENVADYYSLYVLNYRRWEEKRLRYDAEFFRMLVGVRGVRGLLAYHKGEAVAGIVAFAHPHSMFHWHAVSHPDRRRSFGWYRVHYEMMALAVRHGIYRYDMLPAPLERADRIAFHKRGFGAVSVRVWWTPRVP